MNSSLKEILIADLPPTFVMRLIENSQWVYRESRERVNQDTMVGDPERRYLEPHIRRALFERKMYESALDSGLGADVKRVESGAAEYIIVYAGRVVLTCSRTADRYSVPRRSKFRKQYSRINDHISQTQLFPIDSFPGEQSLYGIVIHGPNIQNNGEVGYCCVGFPSIKKGRWADEPIDLIDIQDYQQLRFQNKEDSRAEIQKIEPKIKRKLGISDSEKTA